MAWEDERTKNAENSGFYFAVYFMCGNAYSRIIEFRLHSE